MKVTGWAWIALTSSYQLDFVPSFVISPLGDKRLLCMHKSKAQGFSVSDLLQLKLGCIYMWLWQPSSLSAKLLVWFMLFKSPVHFQACSAALSFIAAAFLCFASGFMLTNYYAFTLHNFKRYLSMTNLSLNIFQRIILRRKNNSTNHRTAFILKMQQQEN